MSKEQQRKTAIGLRRALTDEQRSAYSAAICKKLLSLPELLGVKTVLSYLPSWDEADISAVNAALIERGVTVAYPVCYGKGNMEAYAPERGTDVHVGLYGIKSPLPEQSRHIEAEEIDLVLVPLVAFDARRCRLGHGAGYYDHYLPRCYNVKYIAPAFEAQHLDFVSTDDHDIKMDMVITESAVY